MASPSCLGKEMASCNGELLKEGSNSSDKLHWVGFFEICKSWESGYLSSLVWLLAFESAPICRLRY